MSTYQSPLGQEKPLEFILESFAPICACSSETKDEALFVSAWNLAVGRINDLESQVERHRRSASRRRSLYERIFGYDDQW